MQLLTPHRSGPLRVCQVPRVCFVGKLQGRPTSGYSSSFIGLAYWLHISALTGEQDVGIFASLFFIIEEVGHEGFGQLTKAGNLVHHKSFYDLVAGAPDIARLEIECHLDVLVWKISRFGPRTKESGHINDTPYNFPY